MGQEGVVFRVKPEDMHFTKCKDMCQFSSINFPHDIGWILMGYHKRKENKIK
jgi:hypothetical protein